MLGEGPDLPYACGLEWGRGIEFNPMSFRKNLFFLPSIFLNFILRFALYTEYKLKGANMRVLIVEDNAFNAFCLRRLLESVLNNLNVCIAATSDAALTQLENNHYDLLILDGDLGEEAYGNGPELANRIMSQFPELPIIVWSDTESMRTLFAKVFQKHNQFMNEYNTWNKTISLDHICKTWAYYFGAFMGGQQSAFSKQIGIKDAFHVMLIANIKYWTPTTNFKTGACGVVLAGKDLHIDGSVIRKAFGQAGILVYECS